MPGKNKRPHIPKIIQEHLWLRAGGMCEFRGCPKILYKDNVTQDPINQSNIAHIISWTETGPRGDKELSSKLATDINNLMLMCPEHNHLIDSRENVEKYSPSILFEMKQEHERIIRELISIRTQMPKKVIELRSLVHGQRPSITEKEESDALFPFYPKSDRIVIDVCDSDDIEYAKSCIEVKVNNQIINNVDDDLYAAFIMARIHLGCYLGYVIGNKISVQTFQRFRDTEDWKWREDGGSFLVNCPDSVKPSKDVNLFINVSGTIDSKLVAEEFPLYIINAERPSFDFLQSWNQIITFRKIYREILDRIRKTHGEETIIHLYPATPNPINFEIGRCIMKNLDPTIILYDKSSDNLNYIEIMHLHDRIR